MAKGVEIVVTSNPKGMFLEGIISGTSKPGTQMQIKAAAAMVGGRPTWEPFNRAADGDRGLVAILLPDHLQGKTELDAYVDGTRCFLYCPIAGEEMNVLKLDIAGTGDDLAIGDYLVTDDGTGKFVKTSGTPQSEPFICLETVVDPVADVLVWAMYTGK